MGVKQFTRPCGCVHDGPTGRVTHHCDKHIPAASSAPAETRSVPIRPVRDACLADDAGLQEERRQFNAEIGSLRTQVAALQAEIGLWKHAWETATHDDCVCPVNCEGIIDPACIVHERAALAPQESGK